MIKKLFTTIFLSLLIFPCFSQVSLKASQAEYYEYIGTKGFEANDSGVYPVKLTKFIQEAKDCVNKSSTSTTKQ